MKTIKLGLDGLSAIEKVAKSLFIETKMTAAIATFPTPSPTLLVVKAAREDLEAAVAETLNGGKAATFAKDQAEAVLTELLTQLAGYVMSVAGSDEAKILSSGYELRRRGDPIGDLPAPVNLVATFTDFPGRIDLDWDPVYGAHLYQVYQNDLDPNDPAKWKLITMTTASKFVIEGLVTGVYYWFRVNAVGTAGESPMSDPAKSLCA